MVAVYVPDVEVVDVVVTVVHDDPDLRWSRTEDRFGECVILPLTETWALLTVDVVLKFALALRLVAADAADAADADGAVRSDTLVTSTPANVSSARELGIFRMANRGLSRW
jgi:hypothetical protein